MGNVRFGQIWLDVEQCEGCWHLFKDDNCAFVKSMASVYTGAGYTVGVYASQTEWDATVGSSCDMSQYPLWYPHYDGSANFDDFTPFGGWSKPAMKQYSDGNGNDICGISVDLNWYPL